ncbi:TRAP transporter large permease [Lentisalinibacter orientalis]|uniref:TRAP transporter large permease n=1 Tax=Lentisalinibacter orientalis TaxID=2992241 RepID=UPI003866ACDC
MGTEALIFFLLIFIWLATGVWVGLALIGAAIISLLIFTDVSALALLAFDAWATLTTPELIVLPLFIWMGEILFRSRLAGNLLEGITPLASRVPGGLLHTNVLGCTMFAAVSGSSAATAVTVGRITLGELFARGYERRLSIGSLAGAGTLGFLIPPSIILIIYGVLSETSIIDLFLAGILPGLMLAAIYSGYIAIRCLLNPDLSPDNDEPASLLEIARGLKRTLPLLFLIGLVIGSMYLGIASPIEASVLGVAGSLLLAAIGKELSVRDILDSLQAAVMTSSMIGLILVGALLLSKTATILEIPAGVGTLIQLWDPSPLVLVLTLTLFYLALGCFLDGMSTIMLTLPIVLPAVLGAGFDAVWFGVFLVLVIEMAQITPPIGFNLFVIQGLTGEKLMSIARAAFPFFLLTGVMIALITVFPELLHAFR